ncbi:DUF3037 domain-containing protein [Nocardioides sp.]|uniref:DUF3037 domain-containing protein n=1 Tax=Nocardioides sp. TaxID=35761 RepID=UPI0039E5AF27
MTPYQYVVLRCVPHVEREEFVNVGVVLHCPDEGFLGCAWRVDEDRLRVLAPDLDAAAVRQALDGVDKVCRGEIDVAAGSRATAYGTREVRDDLSTRFGLLKAPRSTVLQPGPVHGGVTTDPEEELTRLLPRLVPST